MSLTREEMQIGRWYIASYGFEHVTGRCVAVGDGLVVLQFRWGTPWRVNNVVPQRHVLIEVADPRFFGLLALFGPQGRKHDRAPAAGAQPEGRSASSEDAGTEVPA